MKQDDGSKSQNGIQSLERAFSILETIAHKSDGISLSQLAREVDLHSSTVFNLVKTMMSLGYVRRIENDKRYRIGGAVFHLAAAAFDEVELVGIADPFLRELAQSTGEACYLAVRESDDAVIVAKNEGAGPFRIADRVGGSRPGYCTALGKVVLASLKDEQLDRYIDTHEFVARTENTITDPKRLLLEIEEIRRKGVAFDDSEFRDELRCIASPVRNFTDQVVAAIGISGPSWHLSLQALQNQAEIVKDIAGQLSAALGAASVASREEADALAAAGDG